MKIAAVTMVKNECDIIELFIKINSRFFDAIYILDHASTDPTAKIIKAMKESGHKIYYTLLNDTVYNQSTITTKAVIQIANLNFYDFIMPIDADEFIPEVDRGKIREFLMKKKSGLNIGFLPWKTYCPSNKRYFESETPLYTNFCARASEENQFYKVILSNRFAKNCTVQMGNHDALSHNENEKIERYLVPSHLIHVPIRSEEQLISKAILGSHAFKLKKDRAPGEGFHWDELSTEIRAKAYSVSENLLINAALNYATPRIKWKMHEMPESFIDLQSDRIGTAEDKIELKEFSKINLIRNFDLQISQIIHNHRIK